MVRPIHYFWLLAEQSPTLLAMLACAFFALSRWKRHPKVSLVVAISLGLMVLHAIIFMFVYELVPPLFISSASYESANASRRVVFLVLGLISNTTAAVAYAILLVGIFMQRRPALQVIS